MLKNEKILEINMKNLRSLPVFFLTIGCFLLAGTAAKADILSITLAMPFQSATENVLAFDATVTNTSSQTVYLNGDSFNVDSPLTLDDSPFDNNYPLFLGAGASFTGVLFNVDVPATTPEGLYSGSFEILGGTNPADDTDVAGAANFNVNVPEPASLILLLTCLAGLGVSLRRRRLAK
jgi:hypothetical protein